MNSLADDTTAMFEDTEKFEKALKRSNVVEITAGIFVTIVFLFYTYLFRNNPILISIGSVLTAAGGLYIVTYIFRNRMRRGEIPPKEEALEYFKYWMGWYQNTYTLGRTIFWWYLLPFIPGFIAFTIGMMQFKPEQSLFIVLLLGSTALMVGGSAYWLNRYYAAKKLQLRIDKLSALISSLEAN